MSGREKGVWLRLQNDFVCVCKEREGVSRPAEREILILVSADGAVRLAVGDVDVSVRGKILSAGLIAEGGRRVTRGLLAEPTDALLVPQEVDASLSNFPALSNLNSINVFLPSPLTPSLLVAFHQPLPSPEQQKRITVL